MRLAPKRDPACTRHHIANGKERHHAQGTDSLRLHSLQSPTGTLYIGVTSDLPARIRQHGNGQVEGFTHKYRIHALAWYEVHETMESAIRREKALKAWKRIWKIELVETSNPQWRDLSAEIR